MSKPPPPGSAGHLSSGLPGKGQGIVLHVGCGRYNPEKLHPQFRSPDWRELRLDIDPAARPDIVATMTTMDGVASASVDAVWTSHSLEHLYPHEVPVALREFHRVLVTGGFVLITVPDLVSIARYIAEDRLDDPIYVSPAGPIAALDILFGCRALLEKNRTYMAHRTGFSKKTLAAALDSAGFLNVTVKTDNRYNLWAVGYKRGAEG
jgi:SAM-dependent methyltransferase